MKLKDKTAIITGGGSGQGKATAKLFAQEGARIVVVDLNKSNLDKTVNEIKEKGYTEIIAYSANVCNENEVKNLVEEAKQNFGCIDILVNCAGKQGPSGKDKMEELIREEWIEVLDVNLIGPWLCSKYVVPIMRSQKKGAIINVSSTAGIRAIPGASPYCVSKAGLIMFTQTTALEYIKHGIRVNCVLPGHIDTPMMENVIYQMKKNGVTDAYNRVHTESNPIGRLGEPGEIASTILFLASDDSSFITGECISVDGGFLAG